MADRIGSGRVCAGVLVAAALTAGLSACSGPRARPAPAPGTADGPPPGFVDARSVPDAVPRHEPRSRYGNPDSYVVKGRRYWVLSSARGYAERGVASWYGRKFHGRTTSSGEPYDMYAMTAAHRTLPLPTYVSVKNLVNGRRIVVRVNDRGPFHDNRLIDLSYVAAAKLGIVRRGTGLVEIRAVEPRRAASPAPVYGASAPGAETVKVYVQAGAFSERGNAERLSARLRTIGGAPVHIAAAPPVRPTVYRVRLGPVSDVAEADRLTRSLEDMGLEAPHVVVE